MPPCLIVVAMVRATALLLAISAPVNGIDQKSMIDGAGSADNFQELMVMSVDYTGKCVYCHKNGQTKLYGCDENQHDQKWYLQQIPAADVGGRTNGYLVKSFGLATQLCLATTWNKQVFGWKDCSTSDDGGNGDRSWLLTQQGGGWQFESARYPGYCLTSKNGKALNRQTCGAKGQIWSFSPSWPAAASSITSSSSGKCLDLPGGDTTDGNLLWIWECDGGPSQQWAWNDMAIQWDGGQVWSHCLGVPGGDLTNGNGVQIWQCNGSPQQQWSYDQSYGSIYLPSSSDAPKCLDLQNAGTNDGTPVQLWDCTTGAATPVPGTQQWSLASAVAQVV